MITVSVKKDLEQLILHPGQKEILFPAGRLGKMMARLSPVVRDWDVRRGTSLSRLLGFPAWWADQVDRGDRNAFDNLLECGGPEWLFFCFRQALAQQRFIPRFRKWLEFHGMEQGFSEVAIRFDGSDFDGLVAWELLGPILPALRQMAVRRENPVRYVSLRILVHDNDDLTRRILWQGFRDTYSPVREILCRHYKGPDRERFYNELYRLMISDPVRRVRMTARERISADFPDLYTINPAGLGDYERVHALEHLDSRFSADENAAIGFLVSENREERFTAAHFLERTGTLKKLLCQADPGDRIALDRIELLLTGAVDVGVCRFLDCLPGRKDAGVLLVGLKLLSLGSRQDLVASVVKTILTLEPDSAESDELIKRVAELIKTRGDIDCFRVLGEALPRFVKYPERLSVLMNNLPSAGAPFFRDILITWLKDPRTPVRGELEAILAGYPPSLVLEDCYSMLHEPAKIEPVVRTSALKILAATGETCIMQNVLENLPLIPVSEVAGLAAGMKKMSGSRYDELMTRLLETRDTELRCTLLNLLPETGSPGHMKFLDEALEDPDPSVRIATAQAISRMGDKGRLQSALTLLLDPEPAVREGAALFFASSGQDAALEAINRLLSGDSELTEVRISAIKGLGQAGGSDCLDILINHIVESGELGESVMAAFAGRDDTGTLDWLTKIFVEALPPVRERLVEVFVRMGERAEKGLVALLEKGNPLLADPLTEILEKTGFIPIMADRLKSPFPDERKEACRELLAVGTPDAIRYVMTALRDVKKEIRTTVLNGLKTGSSANGQTLKAVVDRMTNDPDTDIRKLAAWTLQRIKA